MRIRRNPVMDLIGRLKPEDDVRRARASDAAAEEGIALLKQGVLVIKYGRQGKPHQTMLRLTESEDVLKWEGRSTVAGKLSSVLAKDSERFVALAAVRQLLIGRESTVFRSANWKDRLGVDATAGRPECSLSLVIDPMRHALSRGVTADQLFKEAGSARQSLDVSFQDDMVFGLVLSALRSKTT